MVPVCPALVLVLSHQEVLEQVSEKLECDILESKGWTVEELEKVEVLGLVQSDDRRDVLGAEGRITAVDDVLEVGRRNLRFGDVQREDLMRKLLE